EFLLDFEDLEVLPAPTGREAWKVGRAPEVDVVLDHPSVSKAHATLQRSPDGRFSIRDDSSTNGTFMDDLPVHREWKPLNDGAVISFGDLDFWFLLTSSLYERLA
ncbi:MAG: FHA domain-containing protein, partial [Myxococcaceae bacterium]